MISPGGFTRATPCGDLHRALGTRFAPSLQIGYGGSERVDFALLRTQRS